MVPEPTQGEWRHAALFTTECHLAEFVEEDGDVYLAIRLNDVFGAATADYEIVPWAEVESLRALWKTHYRVGAAAVMTRCTTGCGPVAPPPRRPRPKGRGHRMPDYVLNVQNHYNHPLRPLWLILLFYLAHDAWTLPLWSHGVFWTCYVALQIGSIVSFLRQRECTIVRRGGSLYIVEESARRTPEAPTDA